MGKTTSMPISELVPCGEDTYNNISVQTLDAYGRTDKNYVWTDAGGESWDQIGWVDDENNLVTDVTFAPGQALWVGASSANQSLQTAGSVGQSDVVVQLCSGGILAGNPFPVAMTLGDLIPSGESTYNNISVQILDAYGRTDKNYVWTDAGGESWDQIGWVDDENNLVTDVVISAGQGLWIGGSSAEQYITFPAPEL